MTHPIVPKPGPGHIPQPQICPACGNPSTHALAVDNALAEEGRIAGFSCGTHLWIMQWRADQ